MQLTLDTSIRDLLADLLERGAGVSISRVTDADGVVVTVFTVRIESLANALIKALTVIDKMNRQSEHPQQTH